MASPTIAPGLLGEFPVKEIAGACGSRPARSTACGRFGTAFLSDLGYLLPVVLGRRSSAVYPVPALI